MLYSCVIKLYGKFYLSLNKMRHADSFSLLADVSIAEL